MKYLVRKWKRATRVGSEVVGGTVDQMNGKISVIFIIIHIIWAIAIRNELILRLLKNYHSCPKN